MAPKKGPGDAKQLAPRTPEQPHSHEEARKDAEHAPEVACSECRKLTHRSKEVEEAAFNNHDD